MKNNRLNIEYRQSVRSKSTNEGKIESMRVNTLDRAREIVKGIDSSIVKKAIFKDNNGNETSII